ncbi:protein SODIUM POTASSIUM ROOT DEFECTIVE 2 [Manihot esculenta]|uniref:HMA domain-containing protein n=1 Tax=Manihot esculenta TaxID=3983 RepID=A0A2C9VZ15_MANES|nr:protein SODIUM POTASSIUM ROOT DEFECTIVE 2 [Manihot esculenta]OAY51750.1 hypothetical protein MANES_04G029700v8 [Manihot esculenta]
MKKMELFCASPSSTAICSSLDHRYMVRRGSTRPIEYQKSKSYKRSANKQGEFSRKISADDNSRETGIAACAKKVNDLRRKNSADHQTSDLHSPRGSSSRYLLNDDKVPYIDWISESDQRSKPSHKGSNDSPALARRSSSLANCSRDWILEPYQTTKPKNSSFVGHAPALKSSSSARSHDQVVVLWVSIHCKGCEGKVRKHISKMEGVTSFSIDLAAKKVTVIGNVTPLGVLASLSKVKNAQLWPFPVTSSTPSSIPSTGWST